MSLKQGFVVTCALFGTFSAAFGSELKTELPDSGIYINSESTPIFDIIDGANSSLDISIYQMNDPQVISKLRKAVQRGVKVRILKEPRPEGDPCHLFEWPSRKESTACSNQRKLQNEVVASGGVFTAFNKAELCPNPDKPCVLHGKMVIADQKALLLSTGNFNSTSLCNLAENPEKCDRDYTVITRDSEVIQGLSAVFRHDLSQTRYDLKALLDGPIQKKITVSPFSGQSLIDFIRSAKSVIRVENQYLKEASLNQALKDAAKRGVRVEIMTASACSFSYPRRRDAENIRNTYTQFDEAGALTRMFTSKIKIKGKPGYLHAKAIVVDDSVAWVGSVNGSMAAMTNNREYGLFITEPAWVSALVDIMKKDFASNEAESWIDSLTCKKEREKESIELDF